MKILIIRLSSLGDIVHTYPMLYDIKANVEHCTVDWFVDESFAPLVKLHPCVDNVITIPLRSWKKHKLQLLLNFSKWRKAVKKHHYDYIIDSQGLLKSAILTKLFKGTVVGLGKNSIREKLATLFYTHKFEIGNNHLATTKNRLLAAKVMNYHINVNKINFGLQHLHLPHLKLTQKKYVVFFHATSKTNKKYPISRWAEIATHIIDNHNFAVILPYGNATEKEDSVRLQQLILKQHLLQPQEQHAHKSAQHDSHKNAEETHAREVIVPDKTLDYDQMSSLIDFAEFIFGVDTGLMHLANAFNKPLIAIYVNTDPHKTGVFESEIAKNVGGESKMPTTNMVMEIFEKIAKHLKM